MGGFGRRISSTPVLLLGLPLYELATDRIGRIRTAYLLCTRRALETTTLRVMPTEEIGGNHSDLNRRAGVKRNREKSASHHPPGFTLRAGLKQDRETHASHYMNTNRNCRKCDLVDRLNQKVREVEKCPKCAPGSPADENRSKLIFYCNWYCMYSLAVNYVNGV